MTLPWILFRTNLQPIPTTLKVVELGAATHVILPLILPAPFPITNLLTNLLDTDVALRNYCNYCLLYVIQYDQNFVGFGEVFILELLRLLFFSPVFSPRFLPRKSQNPYPPKYKNHPASQYTTH